MLPVAAIILALAVDFNIFNDIIVNMRKPEMPSLALIAARCGVSPMTVSRALRAHPLVKAETRQRIMTVAEELGYLRQPRLGRQWPGAAAGLAGRVQILAGTPGGTLAVFHAQLLTVIEQQLSTHRYECVIRTCNGDYGQFLTLQESVRRSDARATLIVGSFLPDQLGVLLRAVPDAVLLDNPGAGLDVPHCSFTFDNVAAARLAVRHLLERGRRRILLLCGSAGHYFSRDLESGYRETLLQAGVPGDDGLIRHAAFTAASAEAEIGAALAGGLEFDAVFTNDEMAAGVYRALLERNIAIPQQVAVCGCDALPLGMHLFPRLTTVVLNYEALGRMAVAQVLGRDRESVPSYRVQLLPTLLARESTG